MVEFYNQKAVKNNIFFKFLGNSYTPIRAPVSYLPKYDLLKQTPYLKQLKIKLGEQKVDELLMKHAFLESLHQLQGKEDFESALLSYTQKVRELMNPEKDFSHPQFVYQYFFIVQSMSRYNPEQVEKVVGFCFDFINFLNKKLYFSYAQITLWIGILFFNEGYFNESSKIMSYGFESLKLNPKVAEASKFKNETQEELLFNTFAYWYMCQVELKNKDLAIQCLNKLNDLSLKDPVLKKLLILLNYFQLRLQGKKNLYENSLRSEGFAQGDKQ